MVGDQHGISAGVRQPILSRPAVRVRRGRVECAEQVRGGLGGHLGVPFLCCAWSRQALARATLWSHHDGRLQMPGRDRLAVPMDATLRQPRMATDVQTGACAEHGHRLSRYPDGTGLSGHVFARSSAAACSTSSWELNGKRAPQRQHLRRTPSLTQADGTPSPAHAMRTLVAVEHRVLLGCRLSLTGRGGSPSGPCGSVFAHHAGRHWRQAAVAARNACYNSRSPAVGTALARKR